jgi:hypothetical protein
MYLARVAATIYGEQPLFAAIDSASHHRMGSLSELPVNASGSIAND